MKIRMSDNEQALFKAFVSRAGGYFEFGMGGSTVHAARVVHGPVTAVDSDPSWVADVSALVEPSPHPRTFVHIDIGRTGDWGYPLEAARYDDFRRYSAEIERSDGIVDLCLVDGRFRVACFLEAIRHLRDDAIIGLHDFASRPQYHVVQEFGREIASAEDMSFFVKRRSIDMARLEQVMAAHAADAR